MFARRNIQPHRFFIMEHYPLHPSIYISCVRVRHYDNYACSDVSAPIMFMISGHWKFIEIHVTADMNILHDGACLDLDRLNRLEVKSTPPSDDLHLIRIRCHANSNGETPYRCIEVSCHSVSCRIALELVEEKSWSPFFRQQLRERS